MNIFEIAKICRFQTLESTTGHLNTVWAGDKNITQELEAFAAIISAQAIAKYKASLVPVYGIVDSGTFVSIEETEKGAIRLCTEMNKHDDCNYTYEPLYALPKGST